MGDERKLSSSNQRSSSESKKNENVQQGAAVTKKDDDGVEYVIKNGKTYKKMKPVPKLKDMLREGAPGEIPYNQKDLKGKLMHLLTGPVALAIVFLISLAIWHKAPHNKSTHPGYKLPGFDPEGATGFELIQKLRQAQREQRFREMDQKMERQVDEARRKAEVAARGVGGNNQVDEEF